LKDSWHSVSSICLDWGWIAALCRLLGIGLNRDRQILGKLFVRKLNGRVLALLLLLCLLGRTSSLLLARMKGRRNSKRGELPLLTFLDILWGCGRTRASLWVWPHSRNIYNLWEFSILKLCRLPYRLMSWLKICQDLSILFIIFASFYEFRRLPSSFWFNNLVFPFIKKLKSNFPSFYSGDIPKIKAVQNQSI